MLAMVLTIGLIVPSRAFEVHTGDDDHADTTPLPKDPFRNHIHTMSTNGDYWKLQTTGALVKQTHQKDVPVEVPIVQLADILPSTGFVVVKDMMTGRVLANSTGFFVAPNVVLTAAHLVAPLIRRFHVQLDVISNSRSIASINTYNVIGLSYDFASTPCQILLQVRKLPCKAGPHPWSSQRSNSYFSIAMSS
jgi:V8-like Glu-specific endopeptidase